MLEFVTAIRNGDRSKLLELYTQNRGLLVQLARRYVRIDPGGCDLDDLIQAGFLGLVEAADRWEPARGAWSNIATLCIQKHMRAAVGLGSTRKRAHLGAVSLDKPISVGDEGEGGTLADLLADESLPQSDAALLDQERRAALLRAVGWLKWWERLVMEAFLQGLTVEQTAAALGLTVRRAEQLRASARRRLERDPALRLALGLPIKQSLTTGLTKRKEI